MLRGHQGRLVDIHLDTFTFNHHLSTASLRASAGLRCSICQVLLLRVNDINSTNVDGQRAQDREVFPILAHLSPLDAEQHGYCLRFRTNGGKDLAVFICRESYVMAQPQSRRTSPYGAMDISAGSRLYTSNADSLDSDEVLHLAQHWLSQCRSSKHTSCPDIEFGHRERHYPTRLIELPTSVDMLHKPDLRVRLIATEGCPVQPVQINKAGHAHEAQDKPEHSICGEYVTLSHCWGGLHPKRLLKSNRSEFINRGVLVSELCKTFREAIHLACRLHSSIRYIWIDALCIFQDPDDRSDWARESAKMYDVYRDSLLNISATIARDGNAGLYGHEPRDVQSLWQSDIQLNVGDDFRTLDDHAVAQPTRPIVKYCNLQDTSAWSRLVDDAPVNRRGWVLQERLLAPRVLHFCDGQVAWECRELDATEGMPEGVYNDEFRAGQPVQRQNIKTLMRQEYGRRGIKGANFDPTKAQEDWKKVVDRYSTTALLHPADRLIALAGIAQSFAESLAENGNAKYVAGLWERRLASQLMWTVNTDGIAGSRAERVPVYCAPSFSWASLRTPDGITSARVMKDRLIDFTVQTIDIRRGVNDPLFGNVREGSGLLLDCILKEIKISQDRGLYTWSFVDEPDGLSGANIVLDCPATDLEELYDRMPRLYALCACMTDDGDLQYLLVREKLGETYSGKLQCYQRIGVAQTSPHLPGIVDSPTAIDSNRQLPSTAMDMASLQHRIYQLEMENRRLLQQREVKIPRRSSSMRTASFGLADDEPVEQIYEPWQALPRVKIFLQ